MKVIDILTAPWAIQPEKLDEIQSIYETHLKGDKIDIDAVEKRIGRPLDNDQKPYQIVDGIAVMELHGVIGKRMNLFSQISGGASSQKFISDFDRALKDDAVDSIVISIDSPGGAVDGTQLAAEKVFQSRGIKPIKAIADGLIASAAYWIGSAADELLITSGTTAVGSIGVVAKHMDVSKSEEKAGVKTTEIYAGKYKRITSAYKPLTNEGRETMQAQVDYMYSIFVSDVAKHRGVSVETVLEDMADGRIFIGEQAVEAGLVDGVSTIDDLISKLQSEAAGDVAFSINASEENSMDLETMKAEHPEIAAALIAEGQELGATAERARILGIEAQALAGHEALIDEMKADGETTPEQAAVRILSAEKAKAEARASAIDADAPKPVDHASGDDDQEAEGEKTIEEKCQETWDKDASIRQEFGAFKHYLGYEKAQASGRVRGKKK